MLKLKLQYSGHLKWTTDTLEKTLMLGKTEGRRGWQRMSCMAPLMQWTWTGANSGRRWGTGKPGMLHSMGFIKNGTQLGDRTKTTNIWLYVAFPAAAAAKSLQSCPTLCDPIDSSPPGFPVPGFSRQEHWSGLPFPSPMQESEKWKWRRSVVSDSLRPHVLKPTRLLRPWDFPGKSTGVGCHYKNNVYYYWDNVKGYIFILSLWNLIRVYIACVLSPGWIFVTPLTVGHQAPLSM